MPESLSSRQPTTAEGGQRVEVRGVLEPPRLPSELAPLPATLGSPEMLTHSGAEAAAAGE